MKKLNSILISGIVLVFLNGCGGGSSENNLMIIVLKLMEEKLRLQVIN